MRIGVFDSGVGGLTVLLEIRRHYPQADLVYFGDTAHVPYGNKSEESIINYSLANAEFLQKHAIDVLVVACNTSSAVAGAALKLKFSMPIVEVVSAGVQAVLDSLCKMASVETRVEETKNNVKKGSQKKVVVIGTFRTISSQVYSRSLLRETTDVVVIEKACPLFVPLVEENFNNLAIIEAVVKEYLDTTVKDADILLLGCTHYPLLKKMIGDVYGGCRFKIVDSAIATAQALATYLSTPAKARKLGVFPKDTPNVEKEEMQGKVEIYTSDINEVFLSIAKRLFPDVTVQRQKI